MAQNLTFKPWQRSKLFELAEKDPGGRMIGKMQLTINDTTTGQNALDEVPFMLMAATDIGGLKPGAIKHMAPAPFTRDAETTKLVHIDLWEPSLPWRYTPEKNDAVNMRPWMVLLVGTAKEIQVQGGIANVDKAVLLEHDLAGSRFWAHVQNDGVNEIGRILSPRGLPGTTNKAGLLPQNQYIAVLVPAFNEDGNDMWTVTGNTVKTNFGKKNILPAFHSWQFMTAEAGDFETLAAALHLPPAGDVGKAQLFYRRNIDADDLHINESLEIRGAITSIQKEPEQQAAIKKVRADLDILNDHLENTIGLPQYGVPWLRDPDAVAGGWPEDINDDARYRGIAGLGLWMGIEAQEALVDAAIQQAGALREAGQHIGNLALGLLSSGSLWNRHMPTDKNERLRTLGPMMSRMLAAGGGLVLDKVTGNSPLSPSVFSSAAQRMLRDRSVQARYVTGANGGLNRSDALDEANRLEKLPERSPDGLPHVDAIAKEMGLKTPDELFRIDIKLLSAIWREVIAFVDSFCTNYKRKQNGLSEAEKIAFRNQNIQAITGKVSELLQARLGENHLPCEGMAIIENIGQEQAGSIPLLFAGVLEDNSKKRLFYDNLWRELCRCMGLRPCQEQTANNQFFHGTFCDDLIDAIAPPPLPDKNPVDLGLLSDLIFNALDPRQPDAPAKLRLCSRLQGIDCTRLVRPEFAVGLDFPTWELLKKYDKEWLLPGVNGLEKDSVLALQTNPTFIDAYMMGINTQFMSEMRWRDLAVDRTCTPLRMFWGQVNYAATEKRQADIEPLLEWAKAPAENLGALSHQTILPDDPSNKTGNRLVIVFRSDLFRRYPSTLVYLVKPAEGEDVDALLKQIPVLEHKEDERDKRKFFGPIFVGNITPEINFFSFDVSPDELEKYWLVLDEPPCELRFRNDNPFDKNNKDLTSAVFAKTELDEPTRVAISGAVLKNEGNQ
jgi:hypothetical protein